MEKEKTEELTEREKDVLKLVSQGLTNEEIAQNLNVSLHTAKAHVAMILKKLGVKNRLLAAMKFNGKMQG